MITILLSAALLSGPGAHQETERVQLPSAHMMEHLLHRHELPGVIHAGGINHGRSLNRTVFGFLPYWVNYAWLEYDLISILSCFSVDMGSTGTITNYHGFPATFAQPIDSIHSAGGIAVVTVTNFSASSIHSILTTHRITAILTLVQLVENHPVEGVCIDFEGVGSSDRDNLTSFMQDLRLALDTQVPGSHLSICTPAVDWNGSFDYSELALASDALMMMCYPFHGSWSLYAGPCCPLTGWGSTPESSSNMTWCAGDYVIYAPDVHEKLIIGLPYYGHQWPTSSQNPHSPVQGSCSTLFYTTLASRAELYGRLWDCESLTPWYAFYSDGWNQGWFDDPESLELKYDLVQEADFQGVGIWALGYDGSRPELWDQLEESFTGEPWQDGMTDNLESTFTLHGPSQYWRNYTENGEYYGYFYTYSISSGPDINHAEWTFDLPDSSLLWDLEVFIPVGGSSSVKYRIHHNGLVDTVDVNQASHPGQWFPLGSWYCTSELRVILGDNTGTPGEKILVDAVRFSSTTGVEQILSDDPAAGIRTSGNPAGIFILTVPESVLPRKLEFFDITGRRHGVICRPAGRECTVAWPAESLFPPGIYFVVYNSGESASTLKLVLIN